MMKTGEQCREDPFVVHVSDPEVNLFVLKFPQQVFLLRTGLAARTDAAPVPPVRTMKNVMHPEGGPSVLLLRRTSKLKEENISTV